MLVAWRKPGQKRGHEATLFVQPRDPKREIWNGKRFGVRGTVSRFGVDEAADRDTLETSLPELLESHDRLFFTLGAVPEFDSLVMRVCSQLATKRRRQAASAHPEICDPGPNFAVLRAVKEDAEIACLEHAADITAAGFEAAQETFAPGVTEHAIEAALTAGFHAGGSPRVGYPPIVASGVNACILHYNAGTRKTRSGDLVLIDAGAEWGGYTADVTRTYPVDGVFTKPQAAAYDAVLKAMRAATRAAKVGAAANAPHRAAVRSLSKSLVDLGVLRGDPKKVAASHAYRSWFMHGTSHWLGLDVHDVGAYDDTRGKPVRLTAGNVLTIEPGLYFGARDTRVPKELRGIGIRLEDNVVVTASGPEVLTAHIPVSRKDVERVLAEAMG